MLSNEYFMSIREIEYLNVTNLWQALRATKLNYIPFKLIMYYNLILRTKTHNVKL